jgi:hypothetical protein
VGCFESLYFGEGYFFFFGETICNDVTGVSKGENDVRTVLRERSSRSRVKWQCDAKRSDNLILFEFLQYLGTLSPRVATSKSCTVRSSEAVNT